MAASLFYDLLPGNASLRGLEVLYFLFLWHRTGNNWWIFMVSLFYSIFNKYTPFMEYTSQNISILLRFIINLQKVFLIYIKF